MKENIVEVKIGFNITTEEIEYIKSDFLDEKLGYKEPIEYTAKLIAMGLDKWIRDKIGVFCPNCDAELQRGWVFCPNCGWNSEND